MMEPKGIVGACECAKQKWIPVAERLPEEFVPVLVHVPNEEPYPVVREGYRSPCGFMVPALFQHMEVTHWMPMPQPPK